MILGFWNGSSLRAEISNQVAALELRMSKPIKESLTTCFFSFDEAPLAAARWRYAF
jgi:hypothetical protein